MLAGATVQVAEQKSGVLTNSYGYYSLKLNPDTLLIRISYMGFQTLYHGLFLDHDSVMDYEILPQGVNLEEVLIESERPEDKLDQTQMSNTRISVETIKQIPAFLGEVDVLRVLQLMPGVQSGSEGSTGLYVRGGGQDQNLVLLDDAPVYNSSHLFGFFSIFNSDAISGVELFKGGFPAKYGGKLSSVLDIRMKEGNMKKYHVSGGLGLISSRLTIEGPIIKNKASFILSGRRTYIDLFTRLANKANEERSTYDPSPDYYFNDFNGKINFILGKRDRFFLSGYYGKDVMHYFSGKYTLDFDWGNTTGSLRWNHVFGDKLFLNTSLVYSNFNYNIDNEYTGYKAKIFSNIRDVNGRLDFDWFAGNKHYIKFGAQTIFHEVTPREFLAK